MNTRAEDLAVAIDALDLHDVMVIGDLGRSSASAEPRSMVDPSLIACVIDSLKLRRGAIAGLPADAAVVAYDELCWAFGTALERVVERFDYEGFLRATLGIRGGP